MAAIELVERACVAAGLAPTARAMFGGHGLLAANGAMFAGVWDHGRILLKLTDAASRDELLAQGGETWVQRSPGRTRTMPSWVVAPPSFEGDGKALRYWLARAHAEALARERRPARPKRTPRAPARVGNLELLEDACERARLAYTKRAMFGGHGLFAPNGGMFAAIVDEDRIVVKLADDDARAALVAEGGAPWEYRSKMGATTMKEWICVPEAFYDGPEALASWAQRAHSLAPPKKAKKSAPKAAKKGETKASSKGGRKAPAKKPVKRR